MDFWELRYEHLRFGIQNSGIQNSRIQKSESQKSESQKSGSQKSKSQKSESQLANINCLRTKFTDRKVLNRDFKNFCKSCDDVLNIILSFVLKFRFIFTHISVYHLFIIEIYISGFTKTFGCRPWPWPSLTHRNSRGCDSSSK